MNDEDLSIGLDKTTVTVSAPNYTFYLLFLDYFELRQCNPCEEKNKSVEAYFSDQWEKWGVSTEIMGDGGEAG